MDAKKTALDLIQRHTSPDQKILDRKSFESALAHALEGALCDGWRDALTTPRASGERTPIPGPGENYPSQGGAGAPRAMPRESGGFGIGYSSGGYGGDGNPRSRDGDGGYGIQGPSHSLHLNGGADSMVVGNPGAPRNIDDGGGGASSNGDCGPDNSQASMDKIVAGSITSTARRFARWSHRRWQRNVMRGKTPR